MYISEFICGVIFTTLVEIVLLIAYVIYDNFKKKK